MHAVIRNYWPKYDLFSVWHATYFTYEDLYMALVRPCLEYTAAAAGPLQYTKRDCLRHDTRIQEGC